MPWCAVRLKKVLHASFLSSPPSPDSPSSPGGAVSRPLPHPCRNPRNAAAIEQRGRLPALVYRPRTILEGYNAQNHPSDTPQRRSTPRPERRRCALGWPRARAARGGPKPDFCGTQRRWRGRFTPTSRSRSWSNFSSRRLPSMSISACHISDYGRPAATQSSDNFAFRGRWVATRCPR